MLTLAGLMANKALFLWRMGGFQRRLFARCMALHAVFLFRQCSVNIIVGDGGGFFAG